MKEIVKSLGKGILVGMVVTAGLEITLLSAYHFRGNLKNFKERKEKKDE